MLPSKVIISSIFFFIFTYLYTKINTISLKKDFIVKNVEKWSKYLNYFKYYWKLNNKKLKIRYSFFLNPHIYKDIMLFEIFIVFIIDNKKINNY